MATPETKEERTKVSADAATIAADLVNQTSVREVIPIGPDSSLRYYTHDYPHPFVRWGHHPEYEVHLILKSSGCYVVGDVIDSFEPGQLMLIGPNLPHHWVTDQSRGEVIHDRDAVLHFGDDWIRRCQAAIPELTYLDQVLERSRYGIEFVGVTAARGADALLRIGDAGNPAERVLRMLDLLTTLAAAPADETRPVARAWLPQSGKVSSQVASQAIDYILENLSDGVRLSEAARLASMSDSTFSRYFKAASGQNFTEMVMQLRLTRACGLLKRTTDSVAAIATSVGYQNLSNFNRQFLRAYGMTPRQYRMAGRAPDQLAPGPAEERARVA